MKNTFKGLPAVLSFSLKRALANNSFKCVTLVMLAVLVIAPAVILPLVASQSGSEYKCEADTVYVVDNTPGNKADLSGMKALDYSGISYENTAEDALKAEGKTLWLFIDIDGEGIYTVTVVAPSGSECGIDDANALSKFFGENFSYMLCLKAGVTDKDILDASTSKPEQVINESGYDDARAAVGMIIPYVNIMLLYFMILFYGQGAANLVILEKTSKLMDTFLVSVRPSALIIGKVLSSVISAFLQIAIWLVGLIGGFTAGSAIANAVNPEADMQLLKLINAIGKTASMFTPESIIFALLIFLAGFLLYCALASIGGALASKPEDLSTTNMLFTMALVISFMLVLYGNNFDFSNPALWMHYFPLTAILVTPGCLLVGNIGIETAAVSFLIIAVCALLLMLLAGKLYKTTVFYRGKPLKVFDAIKNLSSNK